jgi:urease subunit alpha
MGRAAESVRRTWQLADKMKAPQGTNGATGGHDNERVLRYLEKYTLCPAIAHGIADHVGSLAPGRLADVVLWRPRFFGVKPTFVIKSGVVSFAMTGPANGSYLNTEPVKMRPEWGGTGAAPARLSKVFTSQLGIEGAKRRQSTHLSAC